jgi:hypothetical protein
VTDAEKRLRVALAARAVDEVEPEAIPGLLGLLEGARARLWQRLASAPMTPVDSGSPPARRLVTCAELAETMKVSRATVFRWSKGFLAPAAVRGGNILRFDSDRALRIMAGRR